MMNSSYSDYRNDATQPKESFEKSFIEEFGEPAFKSYTWVDDSSYLEDSSFGCVGTEDFPPREGSLQGHGIHSPENDPKSFTGDWGAMPATFDTKIMHQFNRCTSPIGHPALSSTMLDSQTYSTAASTPILDLDVNLDYETDPQTDQSYPSSLPVSNLIHETNAIPSCISTHDSYFDNDFDALGRPTYYTSEISRADVNEFKMSGSDTSGREYSTPPSRSIQRSIHVKERESTMALVSRSSIPSVESEHIEKVSAVFL